MRDCSYGVWADDSLRLSFWLRCLAGAFRWRGRPRSLRLLTVIPVVRSNMQARRLWWILLQAACHAEMSIRVVRNSVRRIGRRCPQSCVCRARIRSRWHDLMNRSRQPAIDLQQVPALISFSSIPFEAPFFVSEASPAPEARLLCQRRACRIIDTRLRVPGGQSPRMHSDKMRRLQMRYKTIALILALTVISWAQTSTPNTDPNAQAGTQSSEKAKCPCCEKSNAKDGMACARHGKHAKDSCCAGKEAKCCGGEQAKSCMKGDKSCCSDCGNSKTASCGPNCEECKSGCCNREKKETALLK